jgi:hypothetical protein
MLGFSRIHWQHGNPTVPGPEYEPTSDDGDEAEVSACVVSFLLWSGCRKHEIGELEK